MHQHGLAGLHCVHRHREIVRSHALQQAACGDFDIYAWRYRYGLSGGYQGKLGVAAGTPRPGHLVADGEIAHVASHRGDGAGALRPGDER